MKKIVLLVSTCLITAAVFAYDPNTKVLKAFSETFAAAQNIKWQEFADHYSVSFLYSGIQSKLNYDLEGNILGTTRYYDPVALPMNIFTKLKRENPTKALFGVTEITVGDEMVYFVKMQDAKHWITLKVDPSGNSQVYEKYRKG